MAGLHYPKRGLKMKHKSMSQMNKERKLKPFWKKLLVTKKTVEQDPKNKDTKWVTLDVYNHKEVKKNDKAS